MIDIGYKVDVNIEFCDDDFCFVVTIPPSITGDGLYGRGKTISEAMENLIESIKKHYAGDQEP